MEIQTLLLTFGVIILSALAQSSMQLSTGVFLLLYRESAGRYLKKKTKNLLSNYIVGYIFLTSLLLTSICYALMVLFGGNLTILCLTILICLIFSLAICVWFFYYKTNRSTELWLPKSIIRYIRKRAANSSSNIEAFSLGVLSVVAELPFILALMLVSADSFLKLPALWQIVMILTYTAISVMPLVVLKLSIRHGKTAAEIQKWRLDNLDFTKLISSILFITLGLFLIAFKLVAGGF